MATCARSLWTDMARRSPLLAGLLSAAGLCLAATAGLAYDPPRTPEGTPDLQGIWTNASVTQLQRPPGIRKLVLTEEEARRVEARARMNVAIAEDSKPTDPEEGAPTDGDTARGYNAFWIEPGQHLGRVKGEIRSSWIVDPPDGRIPYRAELRSGILRRLAAARADEDETAGVGPARVSGNMDGPEQRPLGERCLIGFGGTGGPGMLNVLYNNHYQIVQTPDHVMILVEMNHDARIIPIGGRHKPDVIRPWLGDSVGRWEGDTLVVETINVHPQQGRRSPILLSAEGKVTERFTRWSDEQIFYEFTVEDPSIYSRPWRVEMSLNAAEGPIYEYACHEGNYSLPGILAGARAEEAAAR